MKKIYFIQLDSVTAKIEINDTNIIINKTKFESKPIIKMWEDFTPVYTIQFLQDSYHHSSFGISGNNLNKLTQFIAGLEMELTQKEFEKFCQLPF